MLHKRSKRRDICARRCILTINYDFHVFTPNNSRNGSQVVVRANRQHLYSWPRRLTVRHAGQGTTLSSLPLAHRSVPSARLPCASNFVVSLAITRPHHAILMSSPVSHASARPTAAWRHSLCTTKTVSMLLLPVPSCSSLRDNNIIASSASQPISCYQ